MAPAKTQKGDQPKSTPLPKLRVYHGGLANMTPEQKKNMLDSLHARKAAVAAMPDGGMLGPSAKNRYLWVGTESEYKVKQQATAQTTQDAQSPPQPPVASIDAESSSEDGDRSWLENAGQKRARFDLEEKIIIVPLARAKEFDFGF